MKRFDTAGAPHVAPSRSVRGVMGLVLLALLPGVIAHAVFFGPGILLQVVLACAFALALEALMLQLRRQPLRPYLTDLSAPLAAVLFALCLPPLAPWWIAAIGMLAAIVVAKHLYGGLGHNLFNPAMVGFAVVLVSFPLELSRWPAAGTTPGLGDALSSILTGIAPGPGWDAIAEPTPLDAARGARVQGLTPAEGAVDAGAWRWLALAYLGGGLFLLWRKVITWQVPIAMLGTLALVGGALHAWEPDQFASPLQHALTGGAMLCAFFIATDPVSGCTTPRGRLWFGAGVALLLIVIRQWGAYPDGVAFAVLLMNCAAPWIDLHTRPRIYGEDARR